MGTSQKIRSGTPRNYVNGIRNMSSRSVPLMPEEYPDHLPKFYIFSGEGEVGQPVLTDEGGHLLTFGLEAFKPRGKYTTHQTMFALQCLKNGNQCILQRVVPDDIAPRSNLRISIDVLKTELPAYELNGDGSYKLDAMGDPIEIVGTKYDGHRVKYLVEHIDPIVPGENPVIGGGTQKAGTLTDGVNQSTIYPLFDFQVHSLGGDGNNKGIRLYAPLDSSVIPLTRRLLTKESVYPIRLEVLKRENANTSGMVWANQVGQYSVEYALRPDAVDTTTNRYLSLQDEWIASYEKHGTSDENVASEFGPFGRLHVYEENIEDLLKEFYETEKTLINQAHGSDLDGTSENDFWRFNFLGGVQSNGIPYKSFVIDDTSARFTENSSFWATGGSDGTLSYEKFNAAVTAELKRYSNPAEDVSHNTVLHPESVFYDSGFPLDTKDAFIHPLAARPDVIVIWSAFQHGMGKLTSLDQNSLGATISALAHTTIESAVYGTSATRFAVCGSSGVMRDGLYRHRLPVTIELLDKLSAYMGAGNGVWDSSKRPAADSNKVLGLLRDVDVTSAPPGVRDADWENGLIYVENYTREQCYFPAIRSGFNDDTSVLTSLINVFILVSLIKISYRLHRKWTGVDYLTDLQLIDRMSKDYYNETQGRYDNRCDLVITPQYTEIDKLLGYSWYTEIDAYMNSMKTVQSFTVNARRRSEYTGNSMSISG